MKLRRVVTTLVAGVGSTLPLASQDAASPDAPPPAVSQALESLEAGDVEGAIALLQADTSGQPQVGALLGALYVETGNAEEAYRLLAPLAVSDTADPAVLYNAGRAALQLGQLDDARILLGRSAEISPASPASRELGLLLARSNDCRQGYVHLQPWALSNPGDLDAQFVAATCAVELERAPEAEHFLSGLPQDEEPVQLLWGKLLLLKGDPWGALAMLEPLAEGDPAAIDPTLRRLMAEAHLTVGQSSKAIELLEGNVGDDARLVLLLTDAHYQNGDLDRAIGAIEPLARELAATEPSQIALDPAMVADVMVDYGKLLVVAGRHEEAIPTLTLATRLRADSGQAWQSLGQALSAAGRTEDADRAMKRFQELAAARQTRSLDQAELDAADPTGREIKRGFFLARNGSADEALEIARSEAALAPGDFRPWLLESMALLVLDRPGEALASADRALEIAPDNADGYYQRGVVHMSLNNPGLAESDLRQAIEIAPDHTAAMNDLAILLLSKGSRDEARSLLERVLELRPTDEVATENLELLDGG